MKALSFIAFLLALIEAGDAVSAPSCAAGVCVFNETIYAMTCAAMIETIVVLWRMTPRHRQLCDYYHQ